MQTMYHSYTNDELLRIVEGASDSSPLLVELAQRLEKTQPVGMHELQQKLYDLSEKLTALGDDLG